MLLSKHLSNNFKGRWSTGRGFCMLDPLRSCWWKMMIVHVTLSLHCFATVTMKLFKQPTDFKPGRFWKIYPITLTLC
ncbi:hypothetical protein L6452_11404 [Arctium lappa]|uniref:Uncharacterized protein n=1 Tax=Arctium lappa TaxID=4217 RepID=A0ACB9DQ85_ARCLA|nr:hypothetical protein L6452_11404 [Arctium lappa]